ncbi:MAG: packaged DNA stabilization protein [Bdellovibrionales bacterium]
MKLEGFIGPAYTLDSVNVDAQACVNLYPEVIESGRGKEAQVAYLRATPGLSKILEVGNGPIRLIHIDSIKRILVVSGNQLYSISKKQDWKFIVKPVAFSNVEIAQTADDVDTSTDVITKTAHGLVTGLKVRVTTIGTLPAPLAVDTDYYVIRVDDDNFQLASSLANAVSSTQINITDTGGSTMTVRPQIASTVTGIKFTDIDFTSNTIMKASHGFTEGVEVRVLASGLYPTGLSESTSYYITEVTENSFKLALSVTNASAETEIDLQDVSDQWLANLVGKLGEYGGDPVILSTSTGVVKAASMSFLGDGTDSSTVFVDGVNNYLYRNQATQDEFGVMGSVSSASATLDTSTDVVVTIKDGFLNYVGYDIRIISEEDLTLFTDVALLISQPSVLSPGDIILDITILYSPGFVFTTADLVELFNTTQTPALAFPSNPSSSNFIYTINGKTVEIRKNDNPFLNLISASGGDSEDIATVFSGGSRGTFATTLSLDFSFGTVDTAAQIVWSDGFFILNEYGTNKFWVSDLQSFNVDTLSFTSSEGSPDILLALAVSNRYLYAFNEKTIEVFANTGSADFPYDRIPGGFLEIGLVAANSVGKIDGTLLWLGRSVEGQGIVYAMSGLNYRRVSTHAVEQAIRGYADISTASAYTYQDGGHSFYVLNFDEATWVYDLSTGLWHKRAYTNEGTLERHRVETCAFDPTRGVHLAADYETNELYIMSEDYYSDNGDEITRLRAAPHLSSDLARVFCSRFQLDMETGIGLDGGVQGSSPTVMLDWSDDGGHTWSSESWALADAGSGQIGDYKKRVIWRRLGSFRDRIFRVKITDPVKVVLIGAHLELSRGNS